MSGGHLSKEFFELVKSIGESRSKQEEDKIIVQEIAILKQNLGQNSIPVKKMREYMVRAIYIEMLGHDASFAYIHAVKLAHDKNLLAKRIGYLTCNLFLHKDHDLMVLLINTIQKDLNSSNKLEVCAALTSVTRLVNTEMMPAISPLVFKLLSHNEESVRKKTTVAVNRFFKLAPEAVLEHKNLIRKVLCDPDPSVMGASLHILHEMAKKSPQECKDLVPSFVSILKQITEHRLPKDFDYHRMPAPWIQVKLLCILGILGTADQRSSEQMYDILQECMRRADCGVNIGYAIIYECCRTIARIYPERSLLELAASNISRFISSDNHNLKYLGVTGLSEIVKVDASYAAEHQMVVVDCLEDPDDTLKRKTLDLLFRMTNPANVEVVVEKLTHHLKTSVDEHMRRDLVQKITSLAERYAPNNEWFLITMNTVFETGGDLVPSDTAYNLMRIVAEGTGEDEETDMQFRRFAVNIYVKLLEKSIFHYDILVQVIAWVLGEYACLATVDGYELEDIIDLLCDCVDRQFEDPSTRGYLVTALVKLVGQQNLQSSAVARVIKSYRASRLTDLQQRCYEFDQLCQNTRLMRRVLPYDASYEDIEVAPGLPFLDGFVQQRLQEGAREYEDEATRRARKGHNEVVTEQEQSRPVLNFTPYAEPQLRPAPQPFQPTPVGGGNDGVQDRYGGGTTQPDQSQSLGLNVSGPRKWTAQGYNSGSQRNEGARSDSDRPAPPPPSSSQTNGYNAADQRRTDKPSIGGTEPAVPSEKEKMAAALFGGIPGTTAAKPANGGLFANSNGGMSRPSGPFKPPERQVGKETEPGRPQTNGASHPPAHNVAPIGGGSIGGGAVDLLDLDGGGDPLPAAAASSQSESAPVSSSQSQAAAAPTRPEQPASTGANLDLLDFGAGQSSQDPASIAPSAAIAPAAAPPAASNTSDLDLLDFDAGPPVQPPPMSNAPASTLGGPAAAPAAACSAASMPPAAPLLTLDPFQPSPSGVAEQQQQQQQQTHAVAQILAPWQVTTAQVGQIWGSLAVERKAQLQTTALNWQDLMARMQSRLNVHPVEVIGAEGICAGRVLPGTDPCFLHGKLAYPKLDVLVRCQDPNVAQRVVDMCVQLLA